MRGGRPSQVTKYTKTWKTVSGDYSVQDHGAQKGDIVIYVVATEVKVESELES